MVQFAQCHFFHLRRVWSDAAQSPGPSAIVERRLILQRMRTVHQVVVGRIKPGLCIDLGDCFAKSWAGLEAMGAIKRRSEERRVGKSVSVRVDLGGRRIIKKKKKQ